MKDQVKRWLQDGVIDIFLGYKETCGHPLPYCFSREHPEEVDDLIVVRRPFYALEKFATHIAAARPGIKVGMLAGDSSRRALNVLYIWNQLNPQHIETLEVDDRPPDRNGQEDRFRPPPPEVGPYKKQVGVDNNLQPRELAARDSSQRLDRWMYEFQKCIKCYGCRNICPVCFCRECSLEHKELVGPGTLPPEIPIFHLVRAVHMAGRCIDCGLCEEACPVDIPLRLLYRKVNEIVTDVFGYETGCDPGQSPFNILGDTVVLEPKPIQMDKA